MIEAPRRNLRLSLNSLLEIQFKGDDSVSSSPALNWGRIAMAKPVITAQVGSWLELRERDEEEARSALLLEKTVIL